MFSFDFSVANRSMQYGGEIMPTLIKITMACLFSICARAVCTAAAPHPKVGTSKQQGSKQGTILTVAHLLNFGTHVGTYVEIQSTMTEPHHHIRCKTNITKLKTDSQTVRGRQCVRCTTIQTRKMPCTKIQQVLKKYAVFFQILLNLCECDCIRANTPFNHKP